MSLVELYMHSYSHRGSPGGRQAGPEAAGTIRRGCAALPPELNECAAYAALPSCRALRVWPQQPHPCRHGAPPTVSGTDISPNVSRILVIVAMPFGRMALQHSLHQRPYR